METSSSLHLDWAKAPDSQHVRKRYARQIAQRLTATRQALGLTQAELCRRAEINPSTYNQYEKAVNIIDRKRAFRICAACSLSLDWIYFGVPTGLPFGIVQKLPKTLLR
jgi:transcriptional regulator with XRE-family HTH domain